MSIDNLIAFTAKDFHLTLIAPFFIDFMYRILIEGHDLNIEPVLLEDAGSHADIDRNPGEPGLGALALYP